MTRLSCHRFQSSEVRLWLSIISYAERPVSHSSCLEGGLETNGTIRRN
ncbi:MAG: hypothetical protein HYX74_04305 [Acidobacteria bacterium]|nr:hypothetical protein [Acidobacteriota bacterium]